MFVSVCVSVDDVRIKSCIGFECFGGLMFLLVGLFYVSLLEKDFLLKQVFN